MTRHGSKLHGGNSVRYRNFISRTCGFIYNKDIFAVTFYCFYQRVFIVCCYIVFVAVAKYSLYPLVLCSVRPCRSHRTFLIVGIAHTVQCKCFFKRKGCQRELVRAFCFIRILLFFGNKLGKALFRIVRRALLRFFFALQPKYIYSADYEENSHNSNTDEDYRSCGRACLAVAPTLF